MPPPLLSLSSWVGGDLDVGCDVVTPPHHGAASAAATAVGVGVGR